MTDVVASADGAIGLSYAFQLEFDGQVHGSFTECEGLSATIEVDEWQEGGLNGYTHLLPARTVYENITLKQAMFASYEFYAWFMLVSQGRLARKPISIFLRDSQGETIRHWDFDRAFPVKWTGPSLSIDSNDAAVEVVEFAHAGLLPR